MIKPVLLIVDDDAEMAEFVADVADEMGFAALVSTTASEFQALLPKVVPAGIVMDVVMPEMDGFELIRWLGEQECHVPVVIMSGFPYTDLVEAMGGVSGVDVLGALQKPFSASNLEIYLAKLLLEND